jgi:hypothetical protein
LTPPDEVKKWNEETKKITDDYEVKIQEKAVAISLQKASEKREQLIAEWKSIETDMIIPMITAVTGLVGALAAFRYGTRPSPSS